MLTIAFQKFHFQRKQFPWTWLFNKIDMSGNNSNIRPTWRQVTPKCMKWYVKHTEHTNPHKPEKTHKPEHCPVYIRHLVLRHLNRSNVTKKRRHISSRCYNKPHLKWVPIQVNVCSIHVNVMNMCAGFIGRKSPVTSEIWVHTNLLQWMVWDLCAVQQTMFCCLNFWVVGHWVCFKTQRIGMIIQKLYAIKTCNYSLLAKKP